ncbi:hypothetical protein ACLMAJ_12610 [Nocardia sp. KC 131]|uniref:hypothetical protein n=1 Tax=Nocardia arseniciresistens TaxID=3392119 RepID=UPI00398F271C
MRTGDDVLIAAHPGTLLVVAPDVVEETVQRVCAAAAAEVRSRAEDPSVPNPD